MSMLFLVCCGLRFLRVSGFAGPLDSPYPVLHLRKITVSTDVLWKYIRLEEGRPRKDCFLLVSEARVICNSRSMDHILFINIADFMGI